MLTPCTYLKAVFLTQPKAGKSVVSLDLRRDSKLRSCPHQSFGNPELWLNNNQVQSNMHFIFNGKPNNCEHIFPHTSKEPLLSEFLTCSPYKEFSRHPIPDSHGHTLGESLFADRSPNMKNIKMVGRETLLQPPFKKLLSANPTGCPPI